MTTTSDTSHHLSPLIANPQDHFVRLLKDITQLQWVRESLPVQAKYYEGLKQRHERETHLKNLLEKPILDLRMKQDASSSLSMLRRNSTSSSSSRDPKNEPSYTDLIERLRRCETKLGDIETQLRSAETMLQDLHMNKHTLDTHCLNLHTLYDEVVPDIPEDSSQVIERHLKGEVAQLADDIPKIEADIKSHTAAQKKLYESRDLMERAMMTLPGASTFLDRQALAGHASSGQQHSLFMKSPALSSMMDITVPSLKGIILTQLSLHQKRTTRNSQAPFFIDAEKLAAQAYDLESQASKLCTDAVPLVPKSSFNRDDNVISVLTAYRGYRLKVETILRTQLNPRLNKLQCQLAITKYHYEQKTIEWIDQQIIMLEDLLRQNGCLQNISLDREISILRMGSNAAIVAVAAETSGRVTVDDALEVNQSSAEVERNGVLPEYSENASTDSVAAAAHRSSSPMSSTSSADPISNSNHDDDNDNSSDLLVSPTSPSSVSLTLTPEQIDTAAPSSSVSLSRERAQENSVSRGTPSTHQLPTYYQQQQDTRQQRQEDHQRHEYSGPEAPPAYFR